MEANGKILPGDGPGGAGAFYTPFLQSVKDAGFDFVKIDVQAEYLKHADGWTTRSATIPGARKPWNRPA